MTTTEAALGSWGAYDRDDPFPLFAAVRERGPVHPATLADGHDAWLVVGYEEARIALNDQRLSKDMHAALATGGGVVAEGLPGPSFARHMLSVDPPDHSRLRRLVSAAFTPRRVEALRPRVQAVVDDLLDAVAAAGPEARVDLVSAFAFPLPFTVICELLGVPEPDRAALGRGLTALLVPTATPAEYARAKEASDSVVAMLEALVDAKQARPGDDLVSGLIAARDGDERLSTQELLSTIFQLIVAGHDTTASLIGNSVVALLRHPEQLDDLRADPGKLAVAIEELLRYDAPVPHSTFRYAVAPLDLGNVTIPAGAQVIICLAAADRDSGQFADPETLDIDRAESRHLAFGHGIHHCLGAPLARMEGQLALGSLLRRFPALRLAVPVDELHWGHGDGLVLRGLSELPVLPGPAASNEVDARFAARAHDRTPAEEDQMPIQRSGRADDDLGGPIDGDDPGTFPHEGRGEEIDPAVSEEEWVDRSHDVLDEAADLDDPVDALTEGVLLAATEGGPATDSTELADDAAPLSPEEAALVERAGISPAADELSVGLPADSDLDLGRMPYEDLLEAELAALSEGDPETAAILADELERRRRAGS